ncbi:glycosyltransferase [Sphingomonas hankyongi]|uniref:Glycosyltransferase n=1 Tax=Sphingomonas hankyongi TaxID=2908209 RepID=A0ABT0S323_9SPHN|nr:glycosyltransferase [Sphingomonas hankyongi]MCL6730151.1 glycosyltransferase [Sphingomonas hankyongi]
MARLAFVLPSLAGGGAERVALTLVNAFAGAGHDIDLVLASAEGELLRLVPSDVRVFDLRAKRFRNALWPLVRYLRQARPDAVQVSMWPLTILAILARLLSGVRTRLVVSDHGILSHQYGDVVTKRWLRWSVRRLYPIANARIAVSTAAVHDLAKLSGMPEKSFTVVHNPILSAPATPAEKKRAEQLWPEGKKRILSVGSFVPVKNHALLIDALANVHSACGASLMILGEGDCRQALQEMVRARGIADRVAMPGFAINPTAYFENADLFVLSSNHEAYSLVLVEAMAAGLPVVSTDCGGPREILDHGRFGRLVPVGDAPALAQAIADTLRENIDPERQKARARELAKDALARYEALLLKPEASPVPRSLNR